VRGHGELVEIVTQSGAFGRPVIARRTKSSANQDVVARFLIYGEKVDFRLVQVQIDHEGYGS